MLKNGKVKDIVFDMEAKGYWKNYRYILTKYEVHKILKESNSAPMEST